MNANEETEEAPHIYTCAECGGEFEAGWSRAEAIAEKEKLWPGIPMDECAEICDDCFKRLEIEAKRDALEYLAFIQCVDNCLATPELLHQFNRLSGCKLGQRGAKNSLERMVDEATGYAAVIEAEDRKDMAQFVEFVKEFIWLRLTPEVRMDLMNQIAEKRAS